METHISIYVKIKDMTYLFNNRIDACTNTNNKNEFM